MNENECIIIQTCKSSVSQSVSCLMCMDTSHIKRGIKILINSLLVLLKTAHSRAIFMHLKVLALFYVAEKVIMVFAAANNTCLQKMRSILKLFDSMINTWVLLIISWKHIFMLILWLLCPKLMTLTPLNLCLINLLLCTILWPHQPSVLMDVYL